MIKTIHMGNKEVKFDTCFAWCFIYKSQFGKDPAQVLIPAIKDQTENAQENSYALIEKLGFTGITEIAWSMAKLANKKIAEPEEWVVKMGEDFEFIEILSELIPEAIESCFTTKKSKAPIPVEK